MTSLKLKDFKRSFSCEISQLSEEQKKICNKNQYIMHFEKPKKTNHYKVYINEIMNEFDKIINESDQCPYVFETLHKTQEKIVVSVKFTSENDAESIKNKFAIKEKLRGG